ncbi:MAG TPA: glycosyl hydrolase family 65 protein [Streptosporangiaceae bacterium]|nr:glycosyl hydrolase family 65 protein [Streptosporangiaceae bacterium]
MAVSRTAPFERAIFHVGGVLVGSRHHLAWREALTELMEGEWSDIRGQASYSPERFTRELYEREVAGLPRLAGARGVLGYFGVPGAGRRAARYAAVQQEHVGMGEFAVFADALRFVLAVQDLGMAVAAASLSKDTELFLRQIRLDIFAAEQRLDYAFIRPGLTLFQLFDADDPERSFRRAGYDPAMLLTAADALGVTPGRCLVVGDTVAGVGVAKAGKMAALGVARLGDAGLLRAAGADLVVSTLDDVSVEALAEGRLEQRRASAARQRRQQERPPTAWSLVYDGFDPEHQGLREALCALGNGYFVTRGALPEARADGVSYPATYVAGLYNRLQTPIAGRVVENEDLVNVPNWLPLSFRLAGGAWFDIADADVLDHRLELDLRRGMLTRHLRWQDPGGRRTSVVQRRFVSMKDPHLAGLETIFTAENWSGTLEARSGLDGRVINSGVKRYQALNGRHLAVLHAAEAGEETVELQAETSQSHIRIAVAARTKVLIDGQPATVGRRLAAEPGYVGHILTLSLSPGRPVTVEKIAALYTSKDRAISESLLAACQAAQRAAGFGELAARHAAAWDGLWNRFDIQLDSASDWAETALHLHVFHLLQAVSPNSIRLDVGVPARGWHGEAYRGHVFWDEMFIFLVLNFQHTALAGALLNYRYERLGTARAAARAAGYRGAMFPWQGGSDGREESQRLHLNPQSGRWLPDHSHLQRHINIAVAYNVWLHYMVTGSIRFLRFTGAEMLIELARFWASAATYNPQLGRYEILGVMGPDEYHDAYPGRGRPGLDNNTYTNVMAVWVLLRALQALDELPPHYRDEVIGELSLSAGEIDRWHVIARKMRVVFHQDGVLTQFEGYEQLEEFDWEGYRARYGNIQRLDRLLEAEGDSTNRYKVSKQADVLMLLFLLSPGGLRRLLRHLGYEVTSAQLSRTVAYYLDRTAHGSTLSGVVSAWVLARADPGQAWRFLLSVLQSDVADVQGGTTAEGIHLGAMAGTLDIVLLGLTGIQAHDDTLRFDPALPPEIRHLRFSIHYRGHRVEIILTDGRLSVSSRPGPAPPIKIFALGQTRELAPGMRAEFQLERK